MEWTGEPRREDSVDKFTTRQSRGEEGRCKVHWEGEEGRCNVQEAACQEITESSPPEATKIEED